MAKKSEIHKTNAARALDKAKIDYELLTYEVDENDLSAIHVAKTTNQDIKMVYKTIVCECDNDFVVGCIRGDLELDLKALARVSGHKKCELLALSKLEKVTGYIRGGCSPIAMKKSFKTFIDKKALECEKILVSAGIRGKQILIKPNDLANFLNAKFEDISQG